MDKNMIINGKNIKGVKKTVGKYNKLPVEQRTLYNIWYDNVTNKVMLIQNDIFEQCNMGKETYYDMGEGTYDDIVGGFTFLRYDDVSNCINYDYPYLGDANISMSILKSVLSQYVV